MTKRFQLDLQNPYRYLFPIGCFNAIFGVALWIAFRLGWIEIYPSLAHGNLMIGGFVLSYAFGFLWTAIPKFFQAPGPSSAELFPLITVATLTTFFGMFTNPLFFYLAALANVLLTMRFGRKRFLLRRSSPFPSFIFVFTGLILAAISLMTLSVGSIVELPVAVSLFARGFFLKGFVLMLYLGIGMKLVPALLGWAPLPDTGPEKFSFDPLNIFIIAAVLTGLFREIQGAAAQAGVIYGITLVYVAIFRMKLLTLPKTKSALSIYVWISSLIISFAPFALIYDASYATHFWHFIFIGGFGLLTVFVSLRVTLAHSGQAFLVWEKRPIFFVLGGLILLAMLTRVAAPFTPASLLNHYAYAAGVWIIALLIWARYFKKFTFEL